MKKVKYFILFIGLLILTGCSARELTIDRVYPNTTVLEEARERKEQERKEKERKLLEENGLTYALKTKQIAPRDLDLTSEYDSTGYIVKPIQFCWALIPGECENMEPIHPDDNTTPFYSLSYLKVIKNEQIFLGISETVGEYIVPLPTRFEAYVYDEDKNLHLYEAIDNPSRNFEMNPPSKPGSYIFLFKVIYSGNADGISYHTHGITVYEE